MSYRAINAATQTVANLLESHLESDALLRTFFNSTAGGTMVVSPRTPQEMNTANETGLSVWLYHIARDPELLNLPRRQVASDLYEHNPLPLRLHYLMTPIVNQDTNLGNDPGMEQFIIGKVLQTLHDHAQISGSLLKGDLTGTGTVLTIRLEPLGLEEITRIWDALERSYQLCISYEVSLVLVASDEEPERIAPVTSVEPEYGVVSEVSTP